jgi:predicted nucleic acid-binding protein
LSEQESGEEPPSRILVDADVFFSYLVSDDLSIHSERILDRADKGLLKLHAASEIYDDLITALRSNNTPMKVVIEFLGDLRMIRHEVLPTTLDVAAEALRLYSRYGGSRKLHYFDSFHVSTAKAYDLPLITSDRFVLQNSQALGISALDLREI